MAFLLPFVLTLLFAVDTLAVHFSWPYYTFNTIPGRPPKLDITRTKEDPTPGLLFLGPKNNNIGGMLSATGAAVDIYDQDGGLVWHGPDVENTNLKVQTLNGKPVITYWSGKKIEGYGYGSVHILDQTYKEIHTVNLQGDFYTPGGIPADSYIDLHESQITDHGTMLITSYNVVQVDATPIGGQPMTWALKSAFHEIEIGTNKVLFSWSPLDHQGKLPLSDSRADRPIGVASPEAPWDIHHINSVHWVDDGYLISLRHTHSAVFVNKDGSIKWHLDGQNGGDFDLCQDCRFSWQHDIRGFLEAPNQLAITIFNNDGKEGPDKGQPTSGLILALDLDTMTVTQKRKLIDPAQNLNADTQGGFQAINNDPNGSMLIGYGSWASVKEFNANGDVVWTARFGPDAQIASYRAFKFDWHATPWYAPVLQATAYQAPNGHMSTHFYVSWNGATEISEWNFYAETNGAEGGEPVLISSVPKKDFETGLVVEGYLDRVYVEAIDANGASLGKSKVMRSELHGDWSDPNRQRPSADSPAEVAAGVAELAAPEPKKETTTKPKEELKASPVHEEADEEDLIEEEEVEIIVSEISETSATTTSQKITDALPSDLGTPFIFFMGCGLVTMLLGWVWLNRRRRFARYYERVLPMREA